MAKGIPYGISDFSRLIDQNYYYVDKTHFIPQIEEIANYLFLIRPRRFLSLIHISEPTRP